MSVEDRSWMYQGWKDNGCHSEEWVRNTNAFLDRAFSDVPKSEKFGVVCPCSDCDNRVSRRRAVMGMHLFKRGFMLGYTLWTEHGEHPVSEPTLQHDYPGLGMFSGWSTHGMPATAVPSPPAPPPPPAYVASSSPNLSLHNQVASHSGMPATAVSSPPAPPPPPPAYVASSSPNLSLDNVGTLGSSVRMETPEETLSRIAYGGYPCHVNATSGGGGTYSPEDEDEDEFPLL